MTANQINDEATVNYRLEFATTGGRELAADHGKILHNLQPSEAASQFKQLLATL